MLHRACKLTVQNDTETVHLEEYLKSCQDSGFEELSLKQTPPIAVKQRKEVKSPKKKREQRTSIAERILPAQKSIYQTNTDKVQQKFNYNCLRVNSPGDTLMNQLSTQNKAQTKAGTEGGSQFYGQTTVLRDIIKKYKIKSIVSNFVKKIKRVSVLRDPVQYREFKKQAKGWFNHCGGWQIPQTAQNILSLVTILQIVTFSLFYSLSLVYNELKNSQELLFIESLTCVSLALQILINLLTVKHTSGKKLKILRQIWNSYLEGYLIIDCMGVIILLTSILSQWTFIDYFKLLMLLKIPQCLKKLQKLEINFIKNLYNEQYWSLIKIFLFNFSFAHIISILLTGMANLSPQNNWMTIKSIDVAPWYEKYIWAYYWANTIMLTVGFGDFTATNYKEAICLVFIETFSCMAFAYNINCIGGIIQQIIAKDVQRSQKSKIFTKLFNKNKLSQQLSWKINNYIEETAQLRKNFNYEEQKEFIVNLPVEMKKEYLKESNKNIFENIQFFRSFINKTLYNLAEKIEMRVSHPQEIIQHINDDYNLIILKNGILGVVYKRADFQLKQLIMDRIMVKKGQNPLLVNLDFIVRKRPFYEIKSMQYSIFYYLPYEKFIELLRQTQMDYEFFCTLRDRIKNIPDQFQVLDCELCAGKHLKALCPKLHYIPFHQTVIHRHLHQERVSQNQRIDLGGNSRTKKYRNSFHVYKKSIENVEILENIISNRRNRKGGQKQIYTVQCSDMDKTQETSLEKSMHLIHSTLRELTNEVIKQEINKLIRSENYEDDVWMVKSDVLSDFNAYFPEYNPYNISSRYVELAELFRSENLLKAHTSVVMQHSQCGRRAQPKKKLVRSLSRKKQQ